MTNLEYPPHYLEVKTYVVTLQAVSHSLIQTKFNLRYPQSRALIKALQQDHIIMETYSNALQGYQVLVDSIAV